MPEFLNDNWDEGKSGEADTNVGQWTLAEQLRKTLVQRKNWYGEDYKIGEQLQEEIIESRDYASPSLANHPHPLSVEQVGQGCNPRKLGTLSRS